MARRGQVGPVEGESKLTLSRGESFGNDFSPTAIATPPPPAAATARASSTALPLPLSRAVNIGASSRSVSDDPSRSAPAGVSTESGTVGGGYGSKSLGCARRNRKEKEKKGAREGWSADPHAREIPVRDLCCVLRAYGPLRETEKRTGSRSSNSGPASAPPARAAPPARGATSPCT